MNRLFVDCDDTLVIWDKAAEHKDAAGGLYHGDKWQPNVLVVDAVARWKHAHMDGTVVVWSGGGVEYAGMWGRRLLFGVPHVAISKDIGIPTAADVCVDDQPIKVQGLLLTPEQFIESARVEAEERLREQ